MKTILRRMGIGMLAVLAGAMAAPAQTPGTVTFRVTTSDPSGNYSAYILAVWVQNSSGTFVKTLCKRANNRQQYLYKWIANSGQNVVDAITSATVSGTRTENLTWDCQNVSGADVPDGVYRVRLELTDKNGQGPTNTLNHCTFTKGTTGVTVTPSNTSPFSNMQLVYTPTITHDIATTQMSAPATAISGSNVTVTATISNKTATAESNVSVVLRDMTAGADIQTRTITTLAARGTSVQTFTWNTAGAALGDHVLRVTAGPVTGETSTGDNYRESTVNLSAAPPAHDIAVIQLSAPATAFVGDAVTVTATVTNRTASTESNISVVLRDMTAGADIQTKTIASLTGSGRFSVSQVTYTWNTAGAALGDHVLRVTAGPVAGETSTADNSRQSTVAIGAVTHDIAVTQFAAPAAGVIGIAIPISVTVSNLQPIAEANVKVVLRDTTTGVAIRTNTIATLAGRAASVQAFSWMATEPLGEHVLEAEVLPVPAEANLADNFGQGSVVLRVGVHDVAVRAITAPATIAPGATASVGVTVTNQGDFAESFAVALSNLTAAVAVGEQNVTALAPGAAQTLNFSWNTAGRVAGAHLLRAEAASPAGEIDRYDNAQEKWTAIATGTANRTLVAAGSAWKYHDRGVDLHAARWTEPTYYDGLWASGPAQFGYGDGDEATTNYWGPVATNKFPCYYYRKEFTAAATPSALTVRVVRDDGIVVYLNGQEALRSNMAAGPTAYRQWALANMSGTNGTAWFTFPVSPALVVPGRNVIAVELHQSAPNNGDLSFDLSMEGAVPTWTVVRDVALTRLDPAGAAAAGDRVRVRVRAENRGNASDSFTVALSSPTGGGALGVRAVSDLQPGAFIDLDFDWDTRGLAAGEYVLQAAVGGVTADAAPADNTRAYTARVMSSGTAVYPSRVVGSVGGASRAVAVLGDRAYLGEGAALTVLDVAAPAAPATLGRVALPGVVVGLAAAGAAVYAACGETGIHVVDAADAAAPAYVVTLETPGQAAGLAVAGMRLYAADGVGGLRIYDVAAPLSPALLGSFATEGPAQSVAVNGTTAYVADGHQGVLVLDVSNPAAPAKLSLLAGLGMPQALAAEGTMVYTGDGDGLVAVVSAAVPSAPAVLGRVRLEAPVRQLAVAGSTLFAADGAAGLRIVAVDAPAAPVVLATVPAADAVGGVALKGTYACLADGFAGLHVVNVATRAAPASVARVATGVRGRACAVTNGVACVASGSDGVRLYNVAVAGVPPLLGALTAASNACDVAVVGSTLFVADGSYGLEIASIAAPAAPVHLGRYTEAGLGSLRRVAAVGSVAVVTDGHAVKRISAATPSAPVLLNSYAAPGYVYDLALHGAHVLLAAGNAGLIVLDGATLGVVGTLPLAGLAQSVAVAGDVAYVGAGSAGWHVVNLASPAALELVRTESSAGGVAALAAAGNSLFVADAAPDVRQWTVSAPLTPVPAARLGRLARALGLAAQGDRAYVAGDDAGVAILGAMADSDGDGLDDAVEQQMADANPADAIVTILDVRPSDDFDGDGFSNGDEQAAGTSALDPASVFAVRDMAATPGGGTIVLQWNSVAGRRYTVYRGDTLAGPFVPALTGVVATPSLNTATVSGGARQGYFLVTVEP